MLQDQSDEDNMDHNSNQVTHDSHPYICGKLTKK